MPLSDAQLGRHGEEFTCRFLQQRGYDAQLLPTNTPTYDIKASCGSASFFVSVKVSRTKPHVRLGQRKSVLGLSPGNFVFAFWSPEGVPIESLDRSPFELLILPAERVREDSLAIHDAYWAERSRDPNIFSVMVKGYDRYGRPTWSDWQQYRSAWHLLPSAPLPGQPGA